jgi:DNA-binding XRE family transcriptional regulator
MDKWLAKLTHPSGKTNRLDREWKWVADARLKELREKAGMTQPELAVKAGMNRFSVAQLEQARYNPTWETVAALAEALVLLR